MSTELESLVLQLKAELSQGLDQVRKMREEIKKSADSAKQAAKGVKEWSDSTVNGLKKMGEVMGTVALAIGVALGSAEKAFAEFEDRMNTVQAVSNTTAEELDKIRAASLKIGADTKFSAMQAADGFVELGKAGFTVKEQMAGISGTVSLAAAAGIKMGEAAETTSGILRGFGLEAGKAGMVADQLAQAANSSAVDVSDLSMSMKYVAPVARASGQSLSEMMGILAHLGNNMIKGDQAGTTLRGALVKLQAPSKEASAIMSQLGIAIQDQSGKMLPLTQIISEFREKMKGMTETQKSQAMAMVFGQEALSGMMAMLNAAPGEVEKLVNSQDMATGAAQRMSDTMNRGPKFVIEQLTGSIETLAIKIGGDLTPVIEGAADMLTAIINAFIGIPAPIRTVISTILAAVVVGGSLSAALGGILAILPTLTVGLSAMASPIGMAVLGFGALVTVIGMLGSAFRQTHGATLASSQGIKTEIGNVNELTRRFDTLNQKTNRTKKEEEERLDLLKKLREISPSLVTAYNNQGDATDIDRKAVERYNDALKKKLELENQDLRKQWQKANMAAAQKKMELNQAISDEQGWNDKAANMSRPAIAGGQGYVSQDVILNQEAARAKVAKIREEFDQLDQASDQLREQYLLATGQLTPPEAKPQARAPGAVVTNRKTKPQTPLQKAQATLQADLAAAGSGDTEEARLQKQIDAHEKFRKTLVEIKANKEAIRKEDGIIETLTRKIADAHEKGLLKAAKEQHDLDVAAIPLGISQAETIGREIKLDEIELKAMRDHKGTKQEILALEKKIHGEKLGQANAEIDLQEKQATLANDGTLRMDKQLDFEKKRLAKLKEIGASLEDITDQELKIQGIEKSITDAAINAAKAMAGLAKSGMDAVNTESIDDKKAKLAGLKAGLTRMQQGGAEVGDIENRKQEIGDLAREIAKDDKAQKTAVPAFFAGNIEQITGIPKMLTDMAAGFQQALPGLTSALPALAPLFQQLSGVATGLLAAGAPLVPIAAGIAAAMGLLMMVWQQNAGGIQDAVGNIMNALGSLWEAILGVLQPVIDMVGNNLAFLGNLFAIVINVVTAIVNGFTGIVKWVWDILNKFTPIGWLVKSIAGIFQGIWNAIIDAYNWIAEKLEFLGMKKIKKAGETQQEKEQEAVSTEVQNVNQSLLKLPERQQQSMSTAVKEALSTFTSYNPLPVAESGRSNPFAVGPIGRWFGEMKQTLEVVIRPEGGSVSYSDLIRSFQNPSVRAAARDMIGKENGFANITPKFA